MKSNSTTSNNHELNLIKQNISDEPSRVSTYYIQEQNIALYARQMLFMELLQNRTRHGDDSERAKAFLEVRFESKIAFLRED